MPWIQLTTRNIERACAVGLALGALTLAACGGDSGACDAIENTGCDDGRTCEVVSGTEETVCAQPLVVRGKVFRLSDGGAISGARIVAVDANGAPISGVKTSGEDGTYELPVPNARTAEGALVAQEFTLRVGGQGYVLFPSGIRPALPISTTTAVEMDGKLVIKSALTDVALLAPETPGGTNTIAGKVEVPDSRNGVLVVAENAAGDGFSTVADITGDYKIFNVPTGDWTVTAYARGINYAPAAVTVGNNENKGSVNLSIDDARAASTVTGTIQIVSSTVCTSGTPTSIILAVESTFDEAVVRGQTPPGLRVGDIQQDWAIEGVPDGKYVVLAAFENDCWVRDPSSIAGTGIQRITVPATLAAGEFKVTSGIVIGGPGAAGPETITAPPTLTWTAYPGSSDPYTIDVYDALGNVVWNNPNVGAQATSIPYGGDALVPGMYYQWKITAHGGSGTLAGSEDLRGVFLFQP